LQSFRFIAVLSALCATLTARAEELAPDAGAPPAEVAAVAVADAGAIAPSVAESPVVAVVDAGAPRLVASTDAGTELAPAVLAVADAGVAPVAVVAPPTEGALPPLDPTVLGKPGESDEVLITPEDAADQPDPDDSADGEVADGEVDPEGESHEETGPAPLNDHYYTGDLSDSELAKVWKANRSILGPISVGFTDAGRLINGEHFPATGGPWTLVVPENSYGTHETVDFLTTAFRAVDEQFPGGPPGRLNHISGKEGGYLRPHHSHQSGRDADIGFYYKTMPGARVWDRSRYMDLPRNWAFIRAIVTMTDVQFILVDKRIQAALIKYALSIGEDRSWVNSLFHNGATKSIVMHARHHRDHFHVRFFNARAQELGRRIQPMLALDKTEHTNIAHRIRSGDSLGRIAMHYGTSITALKKANGLRSNMIRAGHVLVIPVRGACVNCPMPPPVFVPPRRLPPLPQISALDPH
jgi:murein endopeptidase